MANREFGGSNGFRFLENGYTSVADEYFYAIHFASDTVISATNSFGGDALVSETFPAGFVLYGIFLSTDITITSADSYWVYPVDNLLTRN